MGVGSGPGPRLILRGGGVFGSAADPDGVGRADRPGPGQAAGMAAGPGLSPGAPAGGVAAGLCSRIPGSRVRQAAGAGPLSSQVIYRRVKR